MCRRIKPARHKKHDKMQPLPMLTEPYLDWSKDFITDLPPSKQDGKAVNLLLVIMCRYTKMAQYIPSRKTIDASKLANVVMRKMIFQSASVFRSIVINQGSLFKSDYWLALGHSLGFKKNLIIAFYSQSDSQTEQQNQTVLYPRAYINYRQDNWVQWLPLAEFLYNNSQHAST